MKKKRNIKKVVGVILFMLLLWGIYKLGFLNIRGQTLQKDNEISWTIGAGEIILSDSTRETITIKEKDHPKLFENLDFNDIDVTPFTTNGKTLYLVANRYYQAAGYTLQHAIIVDITSKNPVIYETNESNIQGWFHNIFVTNNEDIESWFIYKHYDYCRSCGYKVSEFLKYDEEKGFVSNNSKHKETFEATMVEIEENNHCAVVAGGKQITFEEIQRRYGGDYRCRPSDDMRWLGITPKEYFVFRDKVKRIIDGEEISMFFGH